MYSFQRLSETGWVNVCFGTYDEVEKSMEDTFDWEENQNNGIKSGRQYRLIDPQLQVVCQWTK